VAPLERAILAAFAELVIVELLSQAGLVVVARLVQGPDEKVSRRYVAILARRP
jgi:hypothetical protein